MLNGILLGFGAAVFQSTSYVGSRIFSHKYPEQPLPLLALSHIVMGIFSVALLPFVWPNTMPAFAEYAPAMIMCTVFYLLGQWLLLAALKKSSASRVSPLLGIKVFILALISISFLGQRFGLLQWIAIVMSVIAAAMLSRTGEKLSLAGLILIFLTCLSYCISDISIKRLMDHFEYLGLVHGSLMTICIAYTASGIISVVILFFVPRPTTTMFVYSIPFAAAWFIAVLFLIACFSSIGVVYGNIVQSSRGIISIIFGVALVKCDFEHLDQKVSRGVFFQRLAAAVLMSCAIALYYLGA